MSIESHVAELKRRHASLEAELSKALAHPSIDSVSVTALKRRKLHLKEEIDRLVAPSLH